MFLAAAFFQNIHCFQDRVPCPLDNKHTVARDELEEHLAK